jgi:hypothetical protein
MCKDNIAACDRRIMPHMLRADGQPLSPFLCNYGDCFGYFKPDRGGKSNSGSESFRLT